MIERKNYVMPKSTPPVSTRQIRMNLRLARTLLEQAKTLLKRKICITSGKGRPITILDAQKLISTVLPGLELTVNEFSEVFSAVESTDVSYDSRVRVPVGDLAAFFRFYGDKLPEQMPSILAFYSIIRTAKSEGLNVHVWVEGLPEAVDIQDVPSSKAHAVRVFQAMQLTSMRKIADNLVEAEQFFLSWLADGNGEGVNYFFRDILEQAAEPSSQA